MTQNYSNQMKKLLE